MNLPSPKLAVTGLLFALVALLTFVQVESVSAHESRPAYLEITETTPGRYSVVWRTPLLSGMRLPILLRFPEGVRDVTRPVEQLLPDSIVERRLIEIDGDLEGRRIEFPGLEATIVDVLVRVQRRDATHSTTLVHPSRPYVDVQAAPDRMAVSSAYVAHGVEHILYGFDHLLFVLALVVIVENRRTLLWTITAFTLAHSITLALATLKVVSVAGPPVEATIALSILLLAVEMVRIRRGETSFTARWPWVVAFSFGLLHGFGFATALTGVGLPHGDIPLALLSFNVGVEIGQLVFIGTVLGVLALARRVQWLRATERIAYPAATYAIGIAAAFWFFERLARFTPAIW